MALPFVPVVFHDQRTVTQWAMGCHESSRTGSILEILGQHLAGPGGVNPVPPIPPTRPARHRPGARQRHHRAGSGAQRG